MRKWFALRKRKQMANMWPILPGSEHPPKNWPGWPHGKKFAFVLTHDVEGPEGLAKCRQLMELEMKWGFRSSFNFIPEGAYQVSRELREELIENGFEVGVHDLHHDGKLYQSREGFADCATRINQYLKDWGAVGFRSGFMFHNLDWLHDLDIEYDASTFDTDPFEPQPDGVGAIFPFWKEGANGQGYVELPYTLPQDSTLFLLFGELTPNIWLQKMDWVAAHGGMALVNVHPDYIQFQGDPASRMTYSVELYEKLLAHLSQKRDTLAWRALPKAVSAFVRSFKPARPRKPKRICMVTHSNYLSDARVTRYAEALADRGDHVDVLSLRRGDGQDIPPKSGKVNVIRIQQRAEKKEQTPLSYLLPILRFFVAATWQITRNHFRQPYDVVHVHNMPDFLVFTAIYPKLSGAAIILDIHDIFPEFYVAKFACREDARVIAISKWIERRSAAVANHVIMSNHLWVDKYAARTGADCTVFINNVDRNIFYPRARARSDGKFIIIFPGGLQWHQGLDIAIRAFHKLSASQPNAEFHIYGDGNMRQSLIDLAHELDLDNKVRIFDPLPVRQIAEVIANADLGVVPKRADSFGNEAYSTKIMEFMSLGIPAVISSTKIDRYYFNDSIVRFFPSGDVDALAAAMLEMICNQKLRQQMAARASEFAEQNRWKTRKGDYLELVDSVCAAAGRDGKE
ncbi:MAG TPA: glycosyltransferase [Candidatus Saccharimonadales bacterium]|nr:glycosyltransferase [Candidatus Saccharimonadales bacterium]